MKARIVKTKFCTVDNKVICRIEFVNPFLSFENKREVIQTVKGVAKCNFNDKFDYTLGARIAEGRAKSNMFCKLHNSSRIQVQKTTDDMVKYSNLHTKEITHINELLSK